MRKYWYDALPGKSKQTEKNSGRDGFDYCNDLLELEKQYSDLDAKTRKTKRLATNISCKAKEFPVT